MPPPARAFPSSPNCCYGKRKGKEEKPKHAAQTTKRKIQAASAYVYLLCQKYTRSIKSLFYNPEAVMTEGMLDNCFSSISFGKKYEPQRSSQSLRYRTPDGKILAGAVPRPSPSWVAPKHSSSAWEPEDSCKDDWEKTDENQPKNKGKRRFYT